MNKQDPNGIGYCTHTWNGVCGCFHECRWRMPDGQIAICYAESIAERLAKAAYPHGFKHHYFHEDRLDDPLRVKEPSVIFCDSMGDLMGHWVPHGDALRVLDVMRRAHWHTFLLLTKNAPGLVKFKDDIPPNVWVGVSLPPTFMWGSELSPHQQEKIFRRSMTALRWLSGVRWVSFEPLSFDVAPILRETGVPFEWAVIGAASNGSKKYQPDPDHVAGLLDVLDEHGVAVWMKNNLEWDDWRREKPQAERSSADERYS